LISGESLILVALFNLLLSFFDTGSEMRCLIVHLLLIFSLPSQHLIEVCELIGELLLVLVLHGLLLKFDVS
jgi:hypothetical protein